MSHALIASAVRTPIGKVGGAFATVPCTALGAAAILSALRGARITPDLVDYVIMGNAIQAGIGQAPARQAALASGLSVSVPCETINKVCASGLIAVWRAANMIERGDAHVVVAGGMESMSTAPYLLPQGRFGYRNGGGTLLDAMTYDGLTDPYDSVRMATQAAWVADELGISREEQDDFAYESHVKAAEAWNDGRFGDEVMQITLTRTKTSAEIIETPLLAGDPGRDTHRHALDRTRLRGIRAEAPRTQLTIVQRDESVRFDADRNAMARLRSIDEGGTITAGNAPAVNDAASAIVLVSEEFARGYGLPALGAIVSHAGVATHPAYLAETPALAARKLLREKGMSIDDIALWEVNEAFASVVLNTIRALGISRKLVNTQGGAIALGHPLGMSGARLIATLAHQLRRRGGGYGVAALCSGGGHGDAVLLKV